MFEPADPVESLRVLANPVRFRIIHALHEHGELAVSELLRKAMAADFSQSALSQHLSALRRHDLVTTRKEGQRVYYSLCRERIAVLSEILRGLKAA